VQERSSITNLLLLTILAGILLVSGSLQCAFDCLTNLDNGYRPVVRVDNCHLVYNEPTQIASCPNNACHQETADLSRFGGPEYHHQQPQDLALASFSHSFAPECKSGEPFESSPLNCQPLLAINSTSSLAPIQSLRELRTTVLLN